MNDQAFCASDDSQTAACNTTGPLHGIRVIDLTINALGPVATQILGDMGAEVIKVEAPQGDPIRQMGPARNPGMGAFFLNMNRNKKSVVLDLKRNSARTAMYRLIETADVFTHNMRLDAIERLGLDYRAVSAKNPNIIYAGATGFRRTSSYRDRPAFDDAVQGMSGMAGLSLPRDNVARYFPTVAVDKLCGYAFALSISNALFYRERTGTSQELHLPMMDTATSFNLLDHLWGGAFEPVEGQLGYPRCLSPNHKPFATRDGYICMVALTDEQWRRVFDVLQRSELAEDPRFSKLVNRAKNIPELYAIVGEVLATDNTDVWMRKFDAAEIPNGPLNSLDDLLTDPYLEETGFFRLMEHPTEGSIRTMSIPVEYSKSPGSIRSLAPALGADTHSVLTDLGFDDNEISEISGSGS